MNRVVRLLVVIGLLVANVCTGCATAEPCTMVVYGQNQFQPYGASLRNGPGTEYQKYASGVAANSPVAVDAWYDTGAMLYPETP